MLFIQQGHAYGYQIWPFLREGTSLIPEKEMQDTVFMCSLCLFSTSVIVAAVHAIDLILSVNFPNLDYLSSAQKHTLNS